jgi:recombinational DNA repair protein (RecF pathway)
MTHHPPYEPLLSGGCMHCNQTTDSQCYRRAGQVWCLQNVCRQCQSHHTELHDTGQSTRIFEPSVGAQAQEDTP